MGIRDGDGQFGIRSTGREGGNGSGLRVNLGIHTDVGKSAGLLGQIDENLGESPTVSYREDRVRDRRNSDDSFFYARRLGLLSEDSPGGSAPAPGLSLPPSSRSTHQQLYQAAYQQKQRQHEDSLQSPQLSDYEQDRRDRSRSSSASSSHSSEGKTSAELTDRDLDRDKLENGGQNGHDKGLDEDIFNEEQYRQQQYVYDENEGQYILR